VTADDIHGGPGTANQCAEHAPWMPSAADVPPRRVDAVVGAYSKDVQVAGIPCDRRDGRVCASGRRDAAHELEPAGPAAIHVPPVTHRAAVGGDGEHVDVFGVAVHHSDLSAWARGKGGQGSDAVPDHLPADAAKWDAERL